jgi:hypothetical protein
VNEEFFFTWFIHTIVSCKQNYFLTHMGVHFSSYHFKNLQNTLSTILMQIKLAYNFLLSFTSFWNDSSLHATLHIENYASSTINCNSVSSNSIRVFEHICIVKSQLINSPPLFLQMVNFWDFSPHGINP